MRASLIALSLLVSVAPAIAKAKPPTVPGPDAIAKAQFTGGEASPAVLAKAQILLDRNHISVGSIDGQPGENYQNALDTFRSQQGIDARGPLDPQTWDKLVSLTPGDVLTTYTITAKDAHGPFTAHIPGKFEAKATLPRLGYTSLREALGERFHVSPAFLMNLNRGKRLAAGSKITVPALPAFPEDLKGKVARLEVDKRDKEVRAYGEDDRLVASYPATIGSTSRPAPTGEHTVKAIAENPIYTYNPAYKFEGVKTTKPFVIKPGPNNPVGSHWIDLSVDGYGIHGTPDPEKIGKTASHGCVRLTNWDAGELLRLVHPGTKVQFIEADPSPTADAPAAAQQASAKR
jgi:lipoprotein-anchoring transpeptidase ErfK/SrfK